MLVSFRFRSSQKRVLHNGANFGIGTLESCICWWSFDFDIRNGDRLQWNTSVRIRTTRTACLKFLHSCGESRWNFKIEKRYWNQ